MSADFLNSCSNERRANLRDVQILLEHKSLKTTGRYTQVDSERLLSSVWKPLASLVAFFFHEQSSTKDWKGGEIAIRVI
jgi:hypothetical protein